MKNFFGLIIAGCLILNASSALAYPRAGDPAPGFTLPDTAGVNHSLSEFSGKTVWLNFWTST